MSEFNEMWNMAASTPEYQRLTEASKLKVRRTMFEAGRKTGMFSREDEGDVMERLAPYGEGESRGLEGPDMRSLLFDPSELLLIALTGGLGGRPLVRGVEGGARALVSGAKALVGGARALKRSPEALGSAVRGIGKKLGEPSAGLLGGGLPRVTTPLPLDEETQAGLRAMETFRSRAAEVTRMNASRERGRELLGRVIPKAQASSQIEAFKRALSETLERKLLPPAGEFMPEVSAPRVGRQALPSVGRVIEQGPRRVPPGIMPPRGEGYPARVTERITAPIREEIPQDLGVVLRGTRQPPPAVAPPVRPGAVTLPQPGAAARISTEQLVADRAARNTALKSQARARLAGKKVNRAKVSQPKAAAPGGKAAEFNPETPGKTLTNEEFDSMVGQSLGGP